MHARRPSRPTPSGRGSAFVPLAAGLLATTALPAVAQDSIELGPVVVTASGYEQQVKDAPASISVIDRETLEKGQYRDVTDALRSMPGVTITGGGAGDRGADISIRGFGSAYTLILVDGKRVDTRETRPNGSAGFEQNWLPPLQAVERIEVIRGPMSTLYGSDAIGGVVNLITRKVPAEWSGSIQTDATLQQNDDSGNAYKSNFYAAGPLVQDLLGLQMWGQYGTREEDDIVYGYEDQQLGSFTGRLTLTPTPDHEITAEAGFTQQDREQTLGKTAPTTGCRGGCTGSESTHRRTHVAVGHVGHLSFGTIDTHVTHEIAENDSRDMEIANTDATTSLVMPIDDHMLTVGGSYTHEALEDLTSNQISSRTEVELTKYAGFIEDEWMITPAFSLTGGARLDYDETYGSHVSPRLYGVWNFTDAWTLKGGVSTGYRAPNLREIAPDWGQTSRGGDVYGNPDLTPETSLNKEIALLYTGPRGLDASVTLFHNDFNDKITRVSCPASICPAGPNAFGSLPTTRINVDEAMTQGVELALTAPLTETLALNASYTYTDSEQLTGAYKGEPLTQLPKHQATAGLDWQATSTLSPWMRVTFRGEESQPTTGPSQSSIVAPSYTFVDLGVSYKLTETAQVNVGIYNLTDEEITYDEYGYVEDGRRVWISLTATF
ncbi:MAG: ligand-gated channel protein [Caenispirillum sp.]|nr:ligand-gated channel protein [Caenispirillum sp.]